MPVRALVFDLFDTLVDLLSEDVPLREHGGRRLPALLWDLHRRVSDSRPDVDFDAFLAAMSDVDREFRRTHYKQGLELSSSERFDGILRALDVESTELADDLVDIHMGRLCELVRFVDHHPDVLAGLKESVGIALCSNFSHGLTARRVLDDCALGEYFDSIVISDEVGIRKPRREIFEAVLCELDLPPHEVMHVGDKLDADVAGAAALGLQTAWITRRVRDPAGQLESHGGALPDHQIADLSELSALLEESGGSG